MKVNHMKRSSTLLGGLLMAVGIGIGQDKEPEVWLPPEALPGATEDPRKQLEEAFQKVEQSLQGMNVLLLDASKGDTSRLAKAGDSDFDSLLQKAKGRPQGAPTDALAEVLYASQGVGQNVLEGIDEILRIASENSDGSSGSSGL
ncbi:MAG: hypothetical protein P1V35_11205 [Planctomycetota bacterium]|nr:hypothetical protein [Planctomycetota bacterium]